AADRLSAARELVSEKADDPEVAKAIIEQISPRTGPELAKGLLAALQSSDAPDVGSLVVAQLPTLTPEVRSSAISLLMAKVIWTKTYLENIEKGKLPLAELSLDQKQALSAHPNEEIRTIAVALLKKGGALPSADREAVIK